MNRPAVRELECFVAVADCLNFSKAARQLNLSQPPLTRHIQSLEEKLGVKLFQRNTHAVSLTEAGVLYREDAQAILSHLDRASATLGRASQGETVRLRLAFIGALLDEKLVRLIQRFRQLHPTCQVQITDLSPSAQLTAIKAGELDGGFIGAQPTQPLKGVAFTSWGTEPLRLALPETHELAKINALTWSQLKNRNWVMVSRAAAPTFRQQFAQLEKARGLSARIIQESERVPAILTMVAAGSGVTMVPQSVTHLISKGVVFRSLPSPQPMLHHAFAHPSGEISAPLAAFLKLLKRFETS
jgi:LysR family transcriptional regulator, benzoate and cis,cis-muconate-responsive activator of ben and cat genes